MQIKRFEAKNMTEALRQIKRELGPDAVILSAKDLRKENRLLGISRKIGVEVTAAIDEDYPDVSSHRNPVNHPEVKDANRNQGIPNHSFLNTIRDNVRLRGHVKPTSTVAKPVPPLERGPSDASPQVKLTTTGIEPSALHTPKDSGHSPMGRYLAKTGLSVGTLTLKKNAANLIALVGNAGVGKTTTIAKLAAHFQLIHNKSVGLLSLDRRRIGGIEQLQCYADSMTLPLEVPANPKDIVPALSRLERCQVVLVDTPAINPGDTNGLARINSYFKTIEVAKTLLVLSAESREEDLQDTALRYKDLNPAGAVVTKTDLTRSYTDLVNFLCGQMLPVFFFSSGQRVPSDLTEATIERLAARFLQNGQSKSSFYENGMEEGSTGDRTDDNSQRPVYLANKNSDIFHRPECKWIRLINQTNIVEFNSFAEALNNRFKPCRYCNPQHLSITRMLSQEGAALQQGGVDPISRVEGYDDHAVQR